jgi:hypothetical protein
MTGGQPAAQPDGVRPDGVRPDAERPDAERPDAERPEVERPVEHPIRAVFAVALLAAGAVGWAAVPMTGAGPGARPALIAAICFAVLSVSQLADRRWIGQPGAASRPAGSYVGPGLQFGRQLRALARTLPWAEGLTVAVLAVEALHRSRPWHTAILGVVLLAYLFAVHLGETAARAAILRPQLPLIAAGLGLLALSVGTAALPATGLGPAAVWLAVLAATAAVIVAALTLPL